MSGPTWVRVYVASNVRMTRLHVFPGFKGLMKDEIFSELFRDFECPQLPRTACHAAKQKSNDVCVEGTIS